MAEQSSDRQSHAVSSLLNEAIHFLEPVVVRVQIEVKEWQKIAQIEVREWPKISGKSTLCTRIKSNSQDFVQFVFICCGYQN